ncbi:Uncharacterised protein [uncultured archaeon]|nr:Uncharacterised protein [uncultured archaeon]
MINIIEMTHPPVISNFASKSAHHICGTPHHEQSKRWAATLISAGGEFVKEGVVVIDYGCGNARCGNYLSGCLKNFTYVGLEPDTPHGKRMLEYDCMTYNDPRFKFGHCDTVFEAEMLQKANIVYLGSVFTHTLIDETYRILDKIMPVVIRGGTVVFSALIGPGYKFKLDGAYDLSLGTSYTFNYLLQYISYATTRNVVLEVCGTCLTEGPEHTIMRLTKK